MDFLALVSFSLTSARVTWASFWSSIEDESDCLVEVECRDGWRVEFAPVAGAARLGRLKVMLVGGLLR